MVVALFLQLRNQIRHPMKKQTAVEWLIDEIVNHNGVNSKTFEQAKAMEREQIIEAHGIKREHDIQNGVDFWKIKHGEQYYIEKFGDHIVDVTKMIKPQQP
jgi:hypothetical protein